MDTDVFNCPSCSAPVHPDGAKTTIECPYCNESVVVPVSLRTPAPYSPQPVVVVSHNVAAPVKAMSGCGCGMVLFLLLLFGGIGMTVYLGTQFATTVQQQDTGVIIQDGLATAMAVVTSIAVDSEPGTTSTPRPTNTERPTRTTQPTPTRPPPPLGEAVSIISGPDAPSGIGFDGSGNFYMLQSSANLVLKYRPNGGANGAWPLRSTGTVRHLVGDGAGTLYLAQGNKVTKYNTAGKLIATWSPGDQVGGLAPRADGGLEVALRSGEIVRFNSEGNIIHRISADVIKAVTGNITDAEVAVDGQGTLYVLDTGSSTIVKMADDGQMRGQVGGTGIGPGRMITSGGIAADRQGRVFVGAGRAVQVFHADGRYLGRIEVPYDGSPVRRLVRGGDNDLYAVTDEELVKFDLTPNHPALTLPDPPPGPPLPGMGGTITTHDWLISLARRETRAYLLYATGNSRLAPDGLYHVLWVDARNQASGERNLAADFTWAVHAADGTAYPNALLSTDDHAAQYIARQSRTLLDAPVAAGGLTHSLLAFDLPASAAPAHLVLTHKATGETLRFDLRR